MLFTQIVGDEAVSKAAVAYGAGRVQTDLAHIMVANRRADTVFRFIKRFFSNNIDDAAGVLHTV